MRIKRDNRGYSDKIEVLMIAVIVLVVNVAFFYVGGYFNEKGSVTLFPAPDPLVRYESNMTFEGNQSEGNSTFYNLTLNKTSICYINLSWEDEDHGGMWENEPDRFSLEVTDPINETEREEEENEIGKEGRIEIIFDYQPYSMFPGNWSLNVTLEEAGDSWAVGVPSVGIEDNYCNYTLEINMVDFR